MTATLTSTYALCGVTCRLGGQEILHGIDLDIRPGEVLALVGPNGAGKSTLLGVISGDVRVAGGSVQLLGREIAQWRTAELSRERSVLAQSNEVSFPFTVRQVVEMGRSPWWGRRESEHDAAAVAAALHETDTTHLADRVFTSLSGGEKARVSLARVLAQDTPVVLLDEPTAALDLRHQEEIMALAGDLADRGRTVVAVVHDLSLAAAYADRVAVIEAGRLVALGTPNDVLTSVLIQSTYGIDVGVREIDGRLVVVPAGRRRSRPHSDKQSSYSDGLSYHDDHDREGRA